MNYSEKSKNQTHRSLFHQEKSLFSVVFLVLLLIISTVFGISALFHPWLLLIAKILNNFEIPYPFCSDYLISIICNGVNDYFDHEIIYSTNVYQKNINQKFIKCMMPHGLVPFSVCCLWNDPKFNYKNNNILVTSHHLYKFPFLSHFAKKTKSIPADYNKMFEKIKNGYSLILFPGGLREMFHTSHKDNIICIKKRKGIFKLALQTGISLLPIYTFGMSQLYERGDISITIPYLFDSESISWYYGRYYTPIPIKKKLLTIVGNPIIVPKKLNFEDKDIDDLRERYIIVIKKLYSEWAPKYYQKYNNSNLDIPKLIIM